MFDDNPQVQSTPEQPQEQPQAPEQSQQTAQPEKPAAPKPPAEPPVKTTQEERMWAAIGYIAFLGVVTLAMKPKSEFCKKHASQGIVLFVIWFIGLIVLALPIALLSGLGFIVIVGISVLAIIGIVKSISSHEFKLPVLTDLAKMVPIGAIVGGLTGKTPPPTQTPQQGEQPAAPVTPETAPEEPKTEEKPTAEPKPEAEQPAPPATEAPAEEVKQETPSAPPAEENKPQEPQQ
jgi:uncharacterized membrane protein